MIEITQKAAVMLKEFLKDQKGPRTIRIFLQKSSWRPSSLAIALDELKENDTIFSEQGITLTIDRDLLEKVKPILLDYVEAGGLSGFLLSSGLSKEDGRNNSFDFINTISISDL